MNTSKELTEWYPGARRKWRRFAAVFPLREVLVSFTAAVLIASLCIARREHLAHLQGREEIHALTFRYEQLNHHVDTLRTIVATLDRRVNFINQLAFGEMIVEEAQPPCELILFADGVGLTSGDTDALSRLVVNVGLLHRKVFPDSIAQRDILDLAQSRQKWYTAVPAIWPLADHPKAALASGYGMRLHPFFHLIKMHQGIDFRAPRGTPVFATAEGEVIAADTAFVGYGTLVIVDHGHGYQTRYAHLEKFLVKPGDRVSQGQVIAHVGNTGQSTASHLHYEVLLQGVPINPIHFLFREERPVDYEKLVNLAFLHNQSLGN